MRIKLFFETLTDPELERKVKGVGIIRLKTSVQFKTGHGLTDPFDALVDTGAPMCLIPAFIWKKTIHTELFDHQVGGISGSIIPAKVGTIYCMLSEWEGNTTEEREIIAYLTLTDQVPLIIGFKDLLSQYIIHLDYRNKMAYIEESPPANDKEGN